MPIRGLPILGLLGLLVIPAPARSAGDEKPSEPGIIVRFRSVDDWIARIDNPTKGAGAVENIGPFIKLALAQRVGSKGLDGLDLKRPLGLYGMTGTTLAEGLLVAVVPITGEEAFLDLLARGGLKVEKGKDGVHTLTASQLPMPLRIRFAHRHAYLGIQGKGDFGKVRLLEPAKVLPAQGDTALVSIMVNLDVVPDALRNQTIAAMEQRFAEERKKPRPGLSKEQDEIAMELADSLVSQMIALVRDGKEWELRLDERWVLETRLRARPGSPLATSIAALASTMSRFAGLLKDDDLLGMLVHLRFSQATRAKFHTWFEQTLADAIKAEKNQSQREILELSRNALMPTIKAGEVDVALTVRRAPKSKFVGAVLAVKVKDGEALERMHRELMKKNPSEKDIAKIVFDAEKVGGVSLHRVDAGNWKTSAGKDAAEVARLFGDNPFYLAYLPDAFILSMGENSLALMKEALAVRPQAGPLLRIQVSPTVLAESMEKKAPGRDILERMKGNFALTVTGGPALSVRFEGLAVLVDAAMRGVRDALEEQKKDKAKPKR
jgi:hypothetical protein